jgi:hypothetical protein
MATEQKSESSSALKPDLRLRSPSNRTESSASSRLFEPIPTQVVVTWGLTNWIVS